VIGFVLGVAVAWLFGFTGAARGVLIVQCAMPVAVINYLYANMFNRHPEEIAGMIVISTAISFATLPALLYVVL
ncbi:MAG: AEC family transporter, partial [Alphaproteobacteria bacterium]